VARYYSLKDVAERLEIPEYTLRYWIRTLGISGRKRNNRMYFSERDVDYFIGIKSLTRRGYTLNSIKSMIKEEGRSVLLRWAEKELSDRVVSDIRDCIREVERLISKLREVRGVH